MLAIVLEVWFVRYSRLSFDRDRDRSYALQKSSDTDLADVSKPFADTPTRRARSR